MGRKLIHPSTVFPENHSFNSDECFKAASGVCSLESDKRPEKDFVGEASYDYCRRLATKAQVWSIIMDFYNGDCPSDIDFYSIPGELIDRINEALDTFISPPQFEREDAKSMVWNTLQLYGAITTRNPIEGSMTALGLDLSDGCHRTCIAKRLNVKVAAVVR